MNKQQRYIILALVAMVVVYGLMTDMFEKKAADTFAFYIVRQVEGESIRDDLPVFTGHDVVSYDPLDHVFFFTDSFMETVNSGRLMTISYTDHNGDLIGPEDYWLHGVSPLGAKYPDGFLIAIDGHGVLTGHFQTPAVMSFVPPGSSVEMTERGLKINVGVDVSAVVVAKKNESGVSIINLEDTDLITPFDKIEAYFTNN